MEIKQDLFDISSRLKEIDDKYSLHYNERSGKYELRGERNELLIVFPYDRIDCRMLIHARRTRVERSRELIEEMERHNEKIIASRERESAEFYQEKLKECAERYYVEKRKSGN